MQPLCSDDKYHLLAFILYTCASCLLIAVLSNQITLDEMLENVGRYRS